MPSGTKRHKKKSMLSTNPSLTAFFFSLLITKTLCFLYFTLLLTNTLAFTTYLIKLLLLTKICFVILMNLFYLITYWLLS